MTINPSSDDQHPSAEAPAKSLYAVPGNGDDLRKALNWGIRNDIGMRCGKDFRPISSMENVVAGLSTPLWQGVLALNEFSGVIEKRKPPPFATNACAGEWLDIDDAELTLWLQRQHDLHATDGDIAKGVLHIASSNRYHPIRERLQALTWDGDDRLTMMLPEYFGAPFAGDLAPWQDREKYIRAVGTRWMIGAVSRIFAPGSKFDYVLILEGPQRRYKSTSLRVLALEDHWCLDTPIAIGTKDAYEAIRAKWIVEIAEWESMNRAEAAAAKAFISSPQDHYRASYGRRAATILRQCVFAGTTNADQYLKDDTGNARFLPVTIGTIDISRLRRDREQLWAQAVHLYRQGEPCQLTHDELGWAAGEQEDRYIGDSYESIIATWARGRLEFTIVEVLGDALKLETAKQTKAEQTRVGACLKRLGWRRKRVRASGGSLEYRYVRADTAEVSQ